jgi:uncharacterized MAPEG superfamily protein
MDKLPLGLISLPVMYFLPYIAHSWKVWLITKYTGDYDNVNPRLNTNRVEQTVTNKEYVRKIKRLEGLHYNLLENFGPWAGAVLAARMTGVSTLWVNYTTVVFLGARMVHFFCYAFGTKLAVANLRSLSFFVSMMATFFLYYLSIKQAW